MRYSHLPVADELVERMVRYFAVEAGQDAAHLIPGDWTTSVQVHTKWSDAAAYVANRDEPEDWTIVELTITPTRVSLPLAD